MSDTPKDKRGGKRPGAGRKQKVIDPVVRNITFERVTVEQVQELGHKLNEFARTATEEKLAKEQNKKK